MNSSKRHPINRTFLVDQRVRLLPPVFVYTPGWSFRLAQPSKHNSHALKSAAPRNSVAAPCGFSQCELRSFP